MGLDEVIYSFYGRIGLCARVCAHKDDDFIPETNTWLLVVGLSVQPEVMSGKSQEKWCEDPDGVDDNAKAKGQ